MSLTFSLGAADFSILCVVLFVSHVQCKAMLNAEVVRVALEDFAEDRLLSTFAICQIQGSYSPFLS